MSVREAPEKMYDDAWPIGKKSAWFTLIVVCALGVFDFIDRQVMAVLFPHLKEEFGFSDTQLGMLASIVNISIAVMVLPSAYFIDHWSRKKMIFLMGLIWSAASGACAFAGTYAHLLFCRFFVGAGEAGYNPAAQSLLAASFPRRLRGTVIATLQVFMGFGAPLGLMLGAFIATHWGWRHAFGVVAIPGLFVAILALWIQDFKNQPKPGADESAAPGKASGVVSWLGEVGHLLAKPTLFCAFFAQALFQIYQIAAMNWLPSYFSRVAGMSLTRASSITAVCLLLGTLLMWAGGPVVDFMRRKSLRVAALGVAVSCVIAFALLSSAYMLAKPGSALQIGLLWASYPFCCCLPTLGFTLCNDLALPQQRATSVSLMVTMQNLFGMTVGPLLTGFLSDMFDLGVSLFLVTLFTLVSGALYFVISITGPRDLAKMPAVSAAF